MSYTAVEIVRLYSQVEFAQLAFENEADFDSFLNDVLLPQASRAIDGYVGHNFLSNSGTILLDGSGKSSLHINRTGLVDSGSGYETPILLPVPMMLITAVSFNGVAKTATDFKISGSVIKYENNIFDVGVQNILIEGTWGYASVPSDIEYCAAQMCSNLLTDMVRTRMMPDMVTPILTGGGSVSVLFRSPKVLTKNEQDILKRYRQLEIAVG